MALTGDAVSLLQDENTGFNVAIIASDSPADDVPSNIQTLLP